MRKLDNDQQKAVDVRKNAVIRAGAGAGKTTVLATRFLDIVKNGEAGVDEILTLTFTQKAAAEMKERIYKTLIASKDNPVISSQIDAFGGAQISTIDSFCSEIARSGASLFGINSEFVSDLPRLRRNIESLAREFIFAKADTSAVCRLITEMGYKGVAEELLVHMAENYFSPARPLKLENAVAVQQEILLRDARLICDSIASFFKTCAEFDPKEGKTMQNVQAVDYTVFTEAFVDAAIDASIDAFTDAAAPELSGVKDAAALVRKITKPRESKKDGLSYVREHIDVIKDAAGRLEIILMTLENEEFVKGFVKLVCEFQDQVIEFKRTSGVLSFGDIMDLAIAVLLENMEIRRYYKQRFKFIMVDEFQDNNSKQKELIYLLAENNDIEGHAIPAADQLEKEKLFFVGDEKQSIYRFRGADVSVFKTLSQELEGAGGESITLGTNYRSEPALIRWFNEIFPAVFGDAAHNYEAGFDPLKFRPQDNDSRVEITVALQEDLEGTDYLKKVESEAWHAASYIKNAVSGASGIRIPLREGGDRLPCYSDFVILMRSTGNSRYFEAMLRHFGIPYETQEPRSLFLAAPINDIYNLLQLVLYPSDAIAMAAFFRSPLCRIDDSLLTELFVYMKERRINSLYSLMLDTDFISHPGFSQNPVLSSALALYQDISVKARSYESAELVQHIWYAGGYHHHVVRFPEFAGHYDFIREAAAVYPSLCEFLDWMRPKLGAAEKLEDAKVFADKGNAVEIMTVHKSKGLEFPIVILADAGNEGLNRGAGSMRYVHHPEWGIAPQMRDEKEKPVNYFYSRGRDEEIAMEHAELKRLLYVALTRAENHLYVSGSVKSTKEKWSFLKMLLLNEDVRENSIELPAIKKQEMLLGSAGTEQVLDVPVPVKSRLSFPEQIRRVSDLEGSITGGEVLTMPALEIDSLIKGIENEFGTLCHRIIEYRIAAGLYDTISKTDIRAFHFPVLVSDSAQNELVLSTAIELSNALFSGECGKCIRQADSVHSEYPVLIKQENYGMRGTVDLICLYADYVKVIDFKSDAFFNTRHYEPQIQAYCEAVGTIYGRQVSGFLINLRDNEMRRVYETSPANL